MRRAEEAGRGLRGGAAGRSGEMAVCSWARAPRRTRPRGAYWLSAVSWVKALEWFNFCWTWATTGGGMDRM